LKYILVDLSHIAHPTIAVWLGIDVSLDQFFYYIYSDFNTHFFEFLQKYIPVFIDYRKPMVNKMEIPAFLTTYLLFCIAIV
jgi:hypothetical protein